jgi:protein-tyrosine kinase
MSIIEKALKSRRDANSGVRRREDDALSTPEEELRRGAPASGEAQGSASPEAVGAQGLASFADAPAGRVGAVPGSPAAATRAGVPDKPEVMLNLEDLRSRGFLIPDQPRSRIAEEFRGIKRPLLRNIYTNVPTPVSQANLIMVTSALQGDGKTFSSINLALSMAMEQDKVHSLRGRRRGPRHGRQDPGRSPGNPRSD